MILSAKTSVACLPTMTAFGISGPQELTGAIDLISRYKLLNHHSFFCKKPLPLVISGISSVRNSTSRFAFCKAEKGTNYI
ncbi:hypothetical protein GUJ93_ZPchr0003g17194 [Zizania palustris]|uniref:Uncharacterized protein n=1 Tax=Zizania palustris TaxID=103762 RepID=A0A8J5SVT0_ZIZPA|nr:hypothetical protein GUJ93_ZPchr0003g17194 [Zizania palustris]KAG8062845.1 hypothetical protein GUJ93_ZPchr0003g17194 [Zizania palustris]KAG8062846.1 hypothetical protein GUJ93_ZPchr0003g17194 [Zizania palustris]